MNKKRINGLSQIELVVVLCVLGMLAIITFSFFEKQQRNRMKPFLGRAGQVVVAYEYSVDSGVDFRGVEKLDAVIGVLEKGVNGTGDMTDVFIKIPEFDPEVKKGIKSCINFESGNPPSLELK